MGDTTLTVILLDIYNLSASKLSHTIFLSSFFQCRQIPNCLLVLILQQGIAPCMLKISSDPNLATAVAY